MRLLMLPRYGRLGASSRLRMLQFVPALEAAGIHVEVKPLLDDEYVTGMYAGHVSPLKVVRSYVRRMWVLTQGKKFDVVWLEKEIWPWLPGWFETAFLPSEKPIVVDYDDAVFHRYDQHPSRWVRWTLGRKIARIMGRASLVTAGNSYLADHATDAGCRQVAWVPTVIDLDRYQVTKPGAGTGEVVIGWVGSPATAEYLRQVTPALRTLQSRMSIRCVAIGARPDQVEGTPFEARPWHEDDEVAMIGQFDIGIMPLPDAPWERGKCGYKLIQYMACGLPVAASPVGANIDIVRPGGNGLLATSTDEWVNALALLAGDPSLRTRMGEAGRRDVEATYSVQAQSPRLVAMLQAVRSGSNKPCVD